MANVLVNESSLTAIGNAIRQKKSETTKYKPSEMAPAILTIDGGSKPVVDNTGVIFADYDGTEIEVWEKADIASKTELPTVPTHEGLIFQGWNWTLEDIQSDTTGQVITVGPYYVTESGRTEYDIEVESGVEMGFSLDTSRYTYLDWGDGTVIETLVEKPSHTYNQAGKYTIKIGALFQQAYSVPTPTKYIKAIRYGRGIKNTDPSAGVNTEYVTIPSDMTWNYSSLSIIDSRIKQITSAKITLQCNKIMFNKALYVAIAKEFNGLILSNLIKYIYIPSTVTTLETSLFSNCTNLSSVTIPDGVTSIPQFCFSNCYNLTSVAIPDSVTSIGLSAFQNCYNLSSITIPESVTSIGSQAFQNCYNLSSITIPESVTSIERSTFSRSGISSLIIPDGVTTLKEYPFQDCTNLSSVTIPESVTTLGYNSFNNCPLKTVVISSSAPLNSQQFSVYSVVSFDFSGCKSVPTLSGGLPNSRYIDVIKVPLRLYYDWINTINWTELADKIEPVGEGLTRIKGNERIAYNQSITLTAQYVADTTPTDITVTASNSDAVVIGDYTLDETAKMITIPITSQAVTDDVTITLNATLNGVVNTLTHTIKIKESYKTPSFTVEDVEGASYNFTLNDNGYYESTNKGVNSSAALCKVNITDLEDSTAVVFDCINSGESSYDFGLISNIDTTLSTSYNVDSTGVWVNFKGLSSTSVQTKTYSVDNVASGYFTLKFRKDDGTASGNDSLQFKVRFE